MAINLKEILISDSDSIKLDKVNYNFDQLLAAGGGPKGPQGEKGDAGLQGITGQKGEIGPQGNQGPVGLKGDSGAELWYGVAGQFNNSVVSVHDPNDYPEPSNVLIGFNYQDAPYNSPNSDTSLLVNRSSYYGSNLRLSSSTVPGFFVDYTVEEANGIKKFKTISSNVAGSKFEWSAGEYNFYDYSTSNLLLSIAANNITTSIDSFFNEPATFNSSLTYNFGTPATGKVVASADSSGLFEWKYPDELGGVAPIGTIVGVLYDKWNDSNNFLGTSTPEVYDIDDDEILPILAGRGVGDYAGWYICNGQTWRNASNSFSYTVPDLNSFSYTIDDNSDSTDPNSQGAVSGSNNNLNLLGGIDLEMQATYDSNTGDYTIGMTQGLADDTIYAGTSGTSYVIKRIPQIIYLGETDLYWTAGGQVNPSFDVTYTFVDTAGVIPSYSAPAVNAQAGATTSLTVTLPDTADSTKWWTGSPSYTGWPSIPPTINTTYGNGQLTVTSTFTNLIHPSSSSTTAVTINYDSSGIYQLIPQTTYVVNLITMDETGSTGGQYGTVSFKSGQQDAQGNTLSGSTHSFVYDNLAPLDIEFEVEWDSTNPNNGNVARVFDWENDQQSDYFVESYTTGSGYSTQGSQNGNWYYSDGSGQTGTFAAIPEIGTQAYNYSTCRMVGHLFIDSTDLPTDGQTHTYDVLVSANYAIASLCGVKLNSTWVKTASTESAVCDSNTWINVYTPSNTPWYPSTGAEVYTLNNGGIPVIPTNQWIADGKNGNNSRRYLNNGLTQASTGTACDTRYFGWSYRNDGQPVGEIYNDWTIYGNLSVPISRDPYGGGTCFTNNPGSSSCGSRRTLQNISLF